jgi:hypothetical protein
VEKAVAVTPVAVPQKRGPGRPKGSVTKHGRGRPKKTYRLVSQRGSARPKKSYSARKGPGRPKKLHGKKKRYY